MFEQEQMSFVARYQIISPCLSGAFDEHFIIGIGRGGWPAYGKIEMGSLFDGAEPVRRLLRQVTRGEPG